MTRGRAKVQPVPSQKVNPEFVTQDDLQEVYYKKRDGILSVSTSPRKDSEVMHRARARSKNRELSVPAIRPEVMHVYSLEQTLSNASDTASKALSRKRRMERVRSLSNEYRAEALAEVHVVPLVYEAMFKALFKELVDSYVIQSARHDRKKKSPSKTLTEKSE